MVLLTGFEPFGGRTVNTSREIVRRLDGTVVGGHVLCGAVLPCEFGRSIRELEHLLHRRRPALVLCLGEASGRTAVTPERVALNLDDASIADNAGRQPVDTPVISGGPAAYWSTLPVKAIAHELRARGIPVALSRDPGGYVCNHLFYGLMHRIRRRRHPPPAGFMHIPSLPAAGESVTLEQLVTAVQVAIDTSLQHAGSPATGVLR